MIADLLVLIPLVAGVSAFPIRNALFRRALLLVVACVHTTLSIFVLFGFGRCGFISAEWLGFDAAGTLFLVLTSLLFLMASLYAVAWFSPDRRASGMVDGVRAQRGESILVGCMLLFLGTMTLATASRNLGLLWVAMEATTLASAPLIYYHRSHHSLEAAWKYLLICSVGIALALIGNLCLILSAAEMAESASLSLSALLNTASSLNVQWLRAAFLFFLIGYGTKMGFAPMHTWLPDAHSEAPSFISALLSGALLNCAFLGLLRTGQVLLAAGETVFFRELLLAFGVLSVLVSAVFLVGQTDYKRMLAYSSVEHMGLMAIGVSLGGGAVYAGMLHAVNHSIAKGFLFLAAGLILLVYRSRSIQEVGGVLKRFPAAGVLWLGGFFAITASPPFGMFFSEWLLLKKMVEDGRFALIGVLVVLLGAIVVAMGTAFFRMALGRRPDTLGDVPEGRGRLFLLLPPSLLLAASLFLGLWIPEWLNTILHGAATLFGGE